MQPVPSSWWHSVQLCTTRSFLFKKSTLKSFLEVLQSFSPEKKSANYDTVFTHTYTYMGQLRRMDVKLLLDWMIFTAVVIDLATSLSVVS